MSSNQNQQELLGVVNEVGEYLKYFEELGIQNCAEVQILQPESAGSARENHRKPVDGSPLSNKVMMPAEDQGIRSQPSLAPPVPPNPSTAKTSGPSIDHLFGEFLPTPNDALPESDETFEQIWGDVGNCTRCPLYEGRTNIVHTDGNKQARLMFVGEAPGADEDAQARPFVGRAGQLLTKIIEAIGMKREEVLIGNVNRCRPPGNRAPTPDEATMCKPFLLREIASARPEVIVVLGNTAMKNLLGTKEGITRARGLFQNYKGVKVMPTFHPAYLLRDPSKKRETWEDLKKVRDYLDNRTTK